MYLRGWREENWHHAWPPWTAAVGCADPAMFEAYGNDGCEQIALPSVLMDSWQFAEATFEFDGCGDGQLPPSISKSKKRKQRRQRLHWELTYGARDAEAASSESMGSSMRPAEPPRGAARQPTDIAALVDSCAPEDRHQVVPPQIDDVQGIRGRVRRLAFHPEGCRLVQSALEAATREQQEAMAEELRGSVLRCAEHHHGNHVLQRCIEQMSPDALGFVAEEIADDVPRLAQHEYACRVIQRLFEFWPCSKLRRVADGIVASARLLIQDKFGNYVVQQVLEHGSVAHRAELLAVVRESLVEFACQKYASRVVEKCLEVLHSSATVRSNATLVIERDALFVKLLRGRAITGGVVCTPLRALSNSRYGSFVVQCFLKTSRGQARDALLQALRRQSREGLVASRCISVCAPMAAPKTPAPKDGAMWANG